MTNMMTLEQAKAAGKTEWVATLHCDNGTVRIAYRSPAALAQGLLEQTANGWVCAALFERARQTNPDE